MLLIALESYSTSVRQLWHMHIIIRTYLCLPYPVLNLFMILIFILMLIGIYLCDLYFLTAFVAWLILSSRLKPKSIVRYSRKKFQSILISGHLYSNSSVEIILSSQLLPAGVSCCTYFLCFDLQESAMGTSFPMQKRIEISTSNTFFSQISILKKFG